VIDNSQIHKLTYEFVKQITYPLIKGDAVNIIILSHNLTMNETSDICLKITQIRTIRNEYHKSKYHIREH
jgi:hypothetical protein